MNKHAYVTLGTAKSLIEELGFNYISIGHINSTGRFMQFKFDVDKKIISKIPFNERQPRYQASQEHVAALMLIPTEEAREIYIKCSCLAHPMVDADE